MLIDEHAKQIALGAVTPEFVAIQDANGRFFIHVKHGDVDEVCDSMYFTTLKEAQEMADHLKVSFLSGQYRL